jgi:hypothetical protein
MNSKIYIIIIVKYYHSDNIDLTQLQNFFTLLTHKYISLSTSNVKAYKFYTIINIIHFKKNCITNPHHNNILINNI